MVTQAVVDLATCFVIALIAARLAPEISRRRVAIAALWLAALCPFTANYSAVVLTEMLVTFLTALAILVLLGAYRRDAAWDACNGCHGQRARIEPVVSRRAPRGLWNAGAAGDSAVARRGGHRLFARWWRPRDWVKLVRAGALMAAGLALPLVPWAARNWRTLHEVQFLAPRYSTLPGEFAPLGFNSWTATWLWRFGDVYNSLWELNDEAIHVSDLPPSAFDSPRERARVAALLDEYNDTLTLTREQDRAFAEIARERTARDPLRTYVKIPVLRSLALWFTPRIELLPYSGQLRPFASEWEEDREDVLVTLGFIAVNAIYLGLALIGAWVARGRCGWGISDRVHSAADDLHRVFCGDAGAALRSRMFSRCDRTGRAGVLGAVAPAR